MHKNLRPITIPEYTNIDKNFIFRKCCQDGYLELACWFAENYHNICVRVCDKLAFQQSCEKGDLVLAKSLVDIDSHVVDETKTTCNSPFLVDSLPCLDVHIDNEYAFRNACANGHLQVACWLAENWSDIDVHADSEYAFRFACRNGHLRVARWLAENWCGIDVHAELEYAFRLV